MPFNYIALPHVMNARSSERRKRCHALWLLLLPLVLSAGCGGFSATKSVSPLDFLLPGLHLRVDPPQPLVPDSTNTLVSCNNGSSPPSIR